MFLVVKNTEEATEHLHRAAETVDRMVDENANYPVDVPAGQQGKWLIRKFNLTYHGIAFTNLRLAVDGFPEMVASPGRYTSLSFLNADNEWEVMMSDTQFEYRTNKDFVDAAHGHVLIAGLGLGMLIRPLAAKPEVTAITIVELDQDVIDLVAPSYADVDKLEIIHQDIFNFVPHRDYYDVIMHDIWPTTSSRNLKQMNQLERRFHFHAGLQFCWARDICERMKEKEKEMLQLAREARNARRASK